MCIVSWVYLLMYLILPNIYKSGGWYIWYRFGNKLYDWDPDSLFWILLDLYLLLSRSWHACLLSGMNNATVFAFSESVWTWLTDYIVKHNKRHTDNFINYCQTGFSQVSFVKAAGCTFRDCDDWCPSWGIFLFSIQFIC